MNRKITLEQESEIVKLLEVKSQKEVAMIFGISQPGIDNVYRLHLYKDSEKFMDYIYNDDNFSYLNRKYSIYSKMKSISGKNQTT
jgi:hypothetical protein